MKKYILLLLLNLSLFCANSQSLSVRLSIEWKKEKNVFYKDTVFQWHNEGLYVNNPYLQITYTNSSDKDIYFLKRTNNKYHLPEILWASIPHHIKMIKELNYPDYSSKNYYVMICNSSFYNGRLWDVDSVYKEIGKEYEMDIINNHLYSIYQHISLKLNPKPKRLKVPVYYEFKSTDITEKGILYKLKDQFCFLKAGESLTDEFNLIGFRLLKGNYSISLYNYSIMDYVYSDSYWDENQKRWLHKQTTLPAKIKNYHLYSGKIQSNKVEIRVE